MQHDEALDETAGDLGGAYDGFDAMMDELAEDARDLRQLRAKEGAGGLLVPRRASRLGNASQPGELLRRLEAGSLTLTSELASSETLRLHASLGDQMARIADIRRKLAYGALGEAHAAAADLLTDATAAATLIVDEVRALDDHLLSACISPPVYLPCISQVRALDAALGCCEVHTSRTRQIPLKPLIGLIPVAFLLWLAADRVVAPARRPGREDGGGVVGQYGRPGSRWGATSSTLRKRF